MHGESKRSAILVTSWAGHTGRVQLERSAASGERPRIDYIELARMLDADVIDNHYMAEHGSTLARAITSRVGMAGGQVTEVFLKRRYYRYIVAWGERLGLALALAFKMAHSRRDLVLVAPCISTPKRAIFLRHLKAHSHLRAIASESSVQMGIAVKRLGVNKDKLHVFLPGVDERFWYPHSGPVENMICSVGKEARDYPTLVRAVQGLDLAVELVIGSVVPFAESPREIAGVALPPNVRLHNSLDWLELRRLYWRSRFVVVPTHDVEFNAGITAVKEAMAVGKAVVVTRSRGQVDYVRDGEHGIYVPPGDPKALRAALEFLTRHPEEAERMGRAGRQAVEERHTLDASVRRLARIVRGGDGSTPKSSPESSEPGDGT